MGNYLDKDGLIAHYKDGQITSMGSEEDINTAIVNAEDTINSYLSGRYDVAAFASNPPSLVVTMTAKLALCELAEIQDEGNLHRDGNYYPIRKAVIDQLKDIARGLGSVANATEKSGGADLVEVQSPTPKYGGGGMDKY